MDAVAILLSLIKEGWLLYYYPLPQTADHSKQAEPRLRINPDRVATIEAHAKTLGKTYSNLYSLSQEANLLRDAVIQSKELSIPKSEISPKLHDLIETDRFDGAALLFACTTWGWINIEYAGKDNYHVSCDTSIARGIPYIFNQVAIMLRAMRKKLDQTEAFSVTCTHFASSQTPSFVASVPGAQVRGGKYYFTVRPDTRLTTRTYIPTSSIIEQSAQAPKQPEARPVAAPAPTAQTKSTALKPSKPKPSAATPKPIAPPATKESNQSSSARPHNTGSFEEVLQEKVLEQLHATDKGLSAIAVQNRLLRFFQREIQNCLDNLSAKGSVEKIDSIHYAIKKNEELPAETKGSNTAPAPITAPEAATPKASGKALADQRSEKTLHAEIAVTPAKDAAPLCNNNERPNTAVHQPNQANQAQQAVQIIPENAGAKTDEQNQKPARPQSELSNASEPSAESSWLKVLELLDKQEPLVKLLIEQTRAVKDDGNELVIAFPANKRLTRAVVLQRRISDIIKKAVSEVFGTRTIRFICKDESPSQAQPKTPAKQQEAETPSREKDPTAPPISINHTESGPTPIRISKQHTTPVQLAAPVRPAAPKLAAPTACATPKTAAPTARTASEPDQQAPLAKLPQPSIDALEPFLFHTLEGAVLFLNTIGMDQLPICKALAIPTSEYASLLNKGYRISSHPELCSDEAQADGRMAHKAQGLRRSEMRLLIQYFVGNITYEQGSIHSRDCYQNNEALDRIFDRFDLYASTSATVKSPSGTPSKPTANKSAAEECTATELGHLAIPEHPDYPVAPKGASACEKDGTALPLDFWPYPFAQIEHRALFLHLLGASRGDIHTGLGISIQRVDDLIDAACRHTALVQKAAYRTSRGRSRVNTHLVDRTTARREGDPMGFALDLPAQCKAYMVGWLLGELELRLADRANVQTSRLDGLQHAIINLLKQWREARIAASAKPTHRDNRTTSTGTESKPLQKPIANTASAAANITPERSSAASTATVPRAITPGHLAPKAVPFPVLQEYPVATGQKLDEPPRGHVLPLKYWPYPFLNEEDQALFLRLLGASVSEISKALGISHNPATSQVKEACQKHYQINKAATYHSWGGVTIDASLIDIKALRDKADPMGFPCTLMRTQRAFLLNWLMGADDARLAEIAGIATHQVISFHSAINEAQRSWIQSPAKSNEAATTQKAQTRPTPCEIKPTSAPQAPVQDALPLSVDPTFDEWIRTLDDFSQMVVIAKIETNSFSSVVKDDGADYRLCRLAYLRAFANKPRLQEDAYLHLVETYNITKERFVQLTGLGGRSYSYLYRTRSQRGVRPLMPLGLEDPKLPAEFRTKLNAMHQKPSANNVIIDGIAVPRRFEALITQLGKSLTKQKPITIAQLQIEYQKLLEKNGLDGQPLLTASNNPQAFSQEVSHTNRFLVPSQKYVRYYNFDAYDFTPVAIMLRKESTRDIECSAQLLFDSHRALMDQLDLRTKDELFAVIKRVCREHRIPNVRTLKNPILHLGKANRHQQVLEIIQELSPANADEIASAYQDRYGVPANTVKTSYLRDFQAYRKHGIYEYRDTHLTDTQRDYLKGLLTDDCHSLSSIKMRYEAAPFSPSSLDINDENLEGLGYTTSHGLVVRKDIDLKMLFSRRLDSHERFCEGDPGFEDAVMSHPAFRSELTNRISLYQIVQFEPGKYISSKKLQDIFGISPSMLSAYARKVARIATPEVPFTVESLRRSGFSDPIDCLREDADFKDCFYETLIESLPANMLIKRTSLDGTKVFCQSRTPLSSRTFIKHIVQNKGAIEIEDLLYLLEDDYGIKTTINVLRGIVDRAYQANDIFYNQQFETLLPDKAANAEFLSKCIGSNK